MAGRDIRAGAAYVEMYVRDRALQEGLRNAQRRLEAFGIGARAIGVRMMGAGGAMLAPLFVAIRSASRMEEMLNKFNVVFGENATAVRAWGDDFAEQVGRSKTQIVEFMAGAQDLFIPLGFEPGAATKMSEQITGLAIDLASFNNKADADVMRDLQAALTGSGEVMKKYGVIVSEAAVKQEMLNQGIDVKKASDQQKVMARMAIILRGTTAAHGDAIRSGGSYANQMKRFWADLGGATRTVGEALLSTITDLVTWGGRAVKMFTHWAKSHGEVILLAAKLAAGLVVAGVAVFAAGVAIVGLGSAVGVLGTLLSVAGAALGLLLSPIGLVVAAVVGLGAYFLAASGAIGGAVDWLRGVFGVLKDDVVKVFGGVADALKAGDMELATKIVWAGIKLEWQRGINWLKGFWEDFRQWFRDSGLAGVFIDAVALIKTAWAELIQYLQENELLPDLAHSKFAQDVEKRNQIIADLLPPGERERFEADVAARRPKGHAERIADIETERKAAQDDITSGKADQDRADREKKARKDLVDAQRELNDLLEEAARKRKEAEDRRKEKGPETKGLPGMPEPAALAAAAGAVGTFSAGQAMLFGGQQNTQQQILAEALKARKQREEHKRWIRRTFQAVRDMKFEMEA